MTPTPLDDNYSFMCGMNDAVEGLVFRLFAQKVSGNPFNHFTISQANTSKNLVSSWFQPLTSGQDNGDGSVTVTADVDWHPGGGAAKQPATLTATYFANKAMHVTVDLKAGGNALDKSWTVASPPNVWFYAL